MFGIFLTSHEDPDPEVFKVKQFPPPQLYFSVGFTESFASGNSTFSRATIVDYKRYF